tara:strand:+ start:3440 stop:3613 length:174 start_codon:yes stop_codon:yes gene_type:complete
VKYDIDEVIEAVHHVLKECTTVDNFEFHHSTLVALELMKKWGFRHISVAGIKIKNYK